MIQTECKGCGQKIKVPEDMAGKRARCPSCGDPVKIPLGSAPASSPEPPRAKTPPPIRRPPSATPIGKPVAPPPMPADNPFDFTAPAAVPPREALPTPPTPLPAVEPPPAKVAAAIPEAQLDFSPPVIVQFSLSRSLATYAGMLGAVAGAGLVTLVGPSEDALTEVLSRGARGNLTAEHLRGALIGFVAGLLFGCALMGLVGRYRTSVSAAMLLTVGGTAYGAIRQAAEGELSWFLVLGGAFLGGLLAAGLGALAGALVDLLRARA
jgi:hypothetical protein